MRRKMQRVLCKLFGLMKQTDHSGGDKYVLSDREKRRTKISRKRAGEIPTATALPEEGTLH